MLRLFYPQHLSGSWTILDDENNLLNRSGGKVRHQLIDSADHVIYYQFNSTHQRGNEEASQSSVRVLALGDSFTFGWGLEESQSYVGLLQHNLRDLHLKPPVQLLNGGVAGWGTADEVAYLQAHGAEVSPQGLIIFVSIDDFRRAIRSNTFHVDEATGALTRINTMKRGSDLKKLLQGSDFYNWLLEHSHLVQLARAAVVFNGGIGTTVGAPSVVTSSDEEQRAEQTIAHAMFGWVKRWCDERRISLVVVNNGWRRYPWLANEMTSLAIRFEDLSDTTQPIMRRDGYDKYFFKLDGHPNADGARLMGEAAWTALEPWFKRLDGDDVRTSR